MTTLVAESEALHARVRAFAHGQGAERFEGLALEIARFQARHSPAFRRLVATRRATLETLADVPGVPTDAFRLTRVAVHPAELDVARFTTSGTTGSERGTHAFRTTRTYEEVALRFGAQALRSSPAPRVVVALAPPPEAVEPEELRPGLEVP